MSMRLERSLQPHCERELIVALMRPRVLGRAALRHWARQLQTGRVVRDRRSTLRGAHHEVDVLSVRLQVPPVARGVPRIGGRTARGDVPHAHACFVEARRREAFVAQAVGLARTLPKRTGSQATRGEAMNPKYAGARWQG